MGKHKERFSDGVKENTENVQPSENQENCSTRKAFAKDSVAKGEITSIVVISPSGESVKEDIVQNNTAKEPFLEQLLEVDDLENRHVKKTDEAADEDKILIKDKKLNQGTSFITSRNYLNEKGVVIAARGSHELKLFIIKGGKITEEDLFRNKKKSDCSDNELKEKKRENFTTLSSEESNKNNNMSYNIDFGGAPLSRMEERAELKQLNDRFTSYVQRVRQLGEQANQVDSSAFLKSTKILEQEINSLKNLYEQELQKLRNELEAMSQDKTCYQVQSSKHQQVAAELQERVSGEVDKNRKLMDEINNLQRKIMQLETELRNSKMNSEKTNGINCLQRALENLRREKEALQKRYEHEQLCRQQAEDRLQQLAKKLEFNDQVYGQQLRDLTDRNEASVQTILSLEARIRELSKSDNSVGEMLKQVREAAESELKKYKEESEAQHLRDINALRSQMEQDSGTIEKLRAENGKLQACINDLNSKIRGLEAQVVSLEKQCQCFEDNIARDRNQATENIRRLENKLRQVQDLLFAKIQEVNNTRDSNVPLKAEIEALKIILEEEERRLQMSLNSQPMSTFSRTQKVTNSPFDGNIPLQKSMMYSSLPVTSFSTVDTINGNTEPVQASHYAAANTTEPFPSDQPYQPYSASQDSIVSPSGPPYPEIQRRLDVERHPGSPGTYEHDFPSTYTPMFLDSEAPAPGMQPTSRYMYERTPSINRLLMADQSSLDSNCDSPRDSDVYNGTMRSKSAPVHASPRENIHLVPTSLGQGRDYFDEMFQDLQRETLYTAVRPKSTPLERTYSTSSHDYTTATTSAVGDIKILEVNQDGKFVRLFNDGAQETEIGSYMIQQNVGGHPVAVYRFPPRTKFAGHSTITVHSGMNDPVLHQPPTDFVWKEQQKWGTGPECTTILCRPNGQAIAWTTAAHRFTRNLCDDLLKEQQGDNTEEERLKEVNMDRTQQEPVYLKREKQQRPTLTPARYPYATSISTPTHPHTGQARPLAMGNDNSTVSRQSRAQTMRPDPIPGQPYAGAAAQRMGSAPLRKYVASQNPTVKANGSLANKAAGQIRYGPPSPFLSPLQQEFNKAQKNRSSLVRFTV